MDSNNITTTSTHLCRNIRGALDGHDTNNYWQIGGDQRGVEIVVTHPTNVDTYFAADLNKFINLNSLANNNYFARYRQRLLSRWRVGIGDDFPRSWLFVRVETLSRLAPE